MEERFIYECMEDLVADIPYRINVHVSEHGVEADFHYDDDVTVSEINRLFLECYGALEPYGYHFRGIREFSEKHMICIGYVRGSK